MHAVAQPQFGEHVCDMRFTVASLTKNPSELSVRLATRHEDEDLPLARGQLLQRGTSSTQSAHLAEPLNILIGGSQLVHLLDPGQ